MAQETQRILIVDDEAPLRDIFAKGLSRNGYSCDTAGSAEEANTLLRVTEFDLVLLDISMPGKTGLSLLATLSKSFPDMAIIMVSGNDDLETATFAMRQGADDYLAKPVPISLLVYRIEKALLRRALVLENKAYRVHLENLVTELNLRLGQNRSVLTALNSLVQSLMRREEETPQAFTGLQQAVSDIGSGLESLAEFSKGIIDGAPVARRPD
jgi:DNA-binding response OmpR family regulator